MTTLNIYFENKQTCDFEPQQVVDNGTKDDWQSEDDGKLS